MYKVMTVEDDVDIQRLLRDILSREGFGVVVCPDGRSALKTAAKEAPDLILLDMHLPDADGIDVCRSLKKDPRTKRIPVIILTGKAREVAQKIEGLEVGADDYLLKPMDPKVLVSRIRSILKIAAPRRRKETK